MRTFIALELPPKIKEALTHLQRDLRDSVRRGRIRWQSVENIHLTLRFIGETSEAQAAAVRAMLAAQAAATTSFHLRAAGVGCFPNANKPRVVWAGVDGDVATMNSLQAAIEAGCRSLGLAAERKPFRAHLTLGRVQRRVSQSAQAVIGEAISRYEFVPTEAWEAVAVSYVRSELTPGGARYSILGRFSFEEGKRSDGQT